MTVYIWTKPKDHPQKLIGIYQDNDSKGDGTGYLLFKKGIYLTKEQAPSMLQVTYKVPMSRLLPFDSLATHVSIPLVNQRLGNLLKALAPDDIQLFDVKVQCVDGELSGYQLVNATRQVALVDRKESDYTVQVLLGGIEMFGIMKNLVVKADCMQNCQLARIEELGLGALMMSQALRDAFKQAKITGVWLPTAPEYFRAARGLG